MHELEITFHVHVRGESGGEHGAVIFTAKQTEALLRARKLSIGAALQLVRDLIKESVCYSLTEASRKVDHDPP